MEPLKDENQELDSQEITIDEFHSKEEQKAMKKVARTLIKNEGNGQIDLSHIENKIMSRREQILLVQTYFKTKFFKDLAMLALAALIMTISFDYFISSTGRTGLFPAGLGSVARFLAILTFNDDVSKQSSFYFIYYFLMNLPLFVFGYIKLGKKFTYTTLLFIGLQIAFDQILQLIPFINPTSFHVIVNYQLLQEIGNSWNSGIWLFIFAALGGVLLGVAYSITYKIGSSTGGSDFLTMYFSNKKNTPIGNINRNVNFCILGVVIILNTAILPMDMINADIKINALSNLGWENALSDGTIDKMIDFAVNPANRVAVIDGQISPEFIFNLGLDSDVVTPENLAENIKNIFTKDGANPSYQYNYLIEILTKKGFGNEMSGVSALKVKVMFMFGPSLFASIVLVLCVSMTTNALYPKYKIRTFLITTNSPKEMNKTLLDKGYQNDIVSWDGTNRINRNYLHRSVIMVSMSVMNWDLIEKEIFLADPHAKINVLKTKAVKGIFNYEIKKNDERDIIHRQVERDEVELEKIRQIAIVKYNKENEKINKKRSKKTKKISKITNKIVGKDNDKKIQ
ncbi:hypothetical protein SCHIN_v1c05640 [Spiroplasma chinense]|uniref:YitT family protein n=1 Tax=Spiroplasma chinense TaxID=216932 RepID=A0A5B9Y409_9MOLU|nr:YitT family ABC transporter [Spiroplasma chinense]QEH61761.1 hypothetical protein SCHIN_v1c05640 [Spiroplasma chinense]